MKTGVRLASLALILLAASVPGMSQQTDKPATGTQNLVRGVGGPSGTNNGWGNYTVWSVVPGSALFPITSATTVFSVGFTAGTSADISNMVVYTTAHASNTITAVTPLTYGGSSSPSISLTNTAICPTAPSTANPCIVKFDSLALSLSPANDYYVAIYFTNDANNTTLGGTSPQLPQSSLWGWYNSGNLTTLIVGNSISVASHSAPIFLMYVTNN